MVVIGGVSRSIEHARLSSGKPKVEFNIANVPAVPPPHRPCRELLLIPPYAFSAAGPLFPVS